MQLSDQSKKFFHIGLAVFFLILASLSLFWLDPRRSQACDGAPVRVRLGTNHLTIGANLYLTNGYHFGKVVKVAQRHEFPDGTIQPAALIKPTNAFRVWIAMEKLTNALVVQ